MLGDKEFRLLVKRNAEKKFDGDYDILISSLCQEEIFGEKVSKLFDDEMKNVGLKSTFTNFTSDIINYRRLQISFPVNIEKWNASDEIPIVTFIPSNYNERIKQKVICYKADGSTFMLDTRKAPEYPVIVIGYNERTDHNGELLSFVDQNFDEFENISLGNQNIAPMLKGTTDLPLAPTNFTAVGLSPLKLTFSWVDNSNNETGFRVERLIGSIWGKDPSWPIIPANQTSVTLTSIPVNYVLPHRVVAFNESGNSFSNIVYTSSGMRSISSKEAIGYIKFSDLGQYESWLSGAPEILITVVDGSARKLHVGMHEPSKRGDINDTWWKSDIIIGSWHPVINGEILSYDFVEYDGKGATVSYKLPILNNEGKEISSITLTIQAQDIHIGQTVVRWWEYPGAEYDLGKMQFMSSRL